MDLAKTRVWKVLLTLWVLALAGGCLGRPAPRGEPREQDTVFQQSTMAGLLAGDYTGHLTVGELLTHGDFGLGTFAGLDGEMLVVDGVVWQARADGRATPAAAANGVPWAQVTWFEPDLTCVVDAASYADLTRAIAAHLPGTQRFYAVRIRGSFAAVTVRSVPPQPQPYPPLNEALQQQVVHDLGPTAGTVVGFYTPSLAEKIGVPGFHFHFLAADGRGGHLLQVAGQGLRVELDASEGFRLQLPPGGAPESRAEHGQYRPSMR